MIDDELAYAPLRDLGWHVEAIPWTRRGVAWRAFHAVVIRSTWDYARNATGFLAAMKEIELSGAALFNSARLVEWNIRKTYLRELATRGVPIVPTVWRDCLEPGGLQPLFEEVGAAEAVVKPVVGAGAAGAYRLNAQTIAERAAEVESLYADEALMAQPFLREVVAEGEYSLFYFNGRLSHAILKTPRAGDYRVQEEHGGVIRSIAADADLLAAGQAALEAIGEAPLYARADFVRGGEGAGFWLMELELIEPSLYLRMDEGAPRRFAEALDRRVAGA